MSVAAVYCWSPHVAGLFQTVSASQTPLLQSVNIARQKESSIFFTWADVIGKGPDQKDCILNVVQSTVMFNACCVDYLTHMPCTKFSPCSLAKYV